MKKLQLKKEVIAELHKSHMNNVRGGYDGPGSDNLCTIPNYTCVCTGNEYSCKCPVYSVSPCTSPPRCCDYGCCDTTGC